MKKTMIFSTMLALVFALSLAGTAGAVPYRKGDPPNIEKERNETMVHHASSAAEGTGHAFTLRPSLGIENGSGTVSLAPERPERTPEPYTRYSGNARVDRPNYGIENASGAYK